MANARYPFNIDFEKRKFYFKNLSKIKKTNQSNCYIMHTVPTNFKSNIVYDDNTR